MRDVVVTVPKAQWANWIGEGDLPGEVARFDSHFWIKAGSHPDIGPDSRLYIVSHGRLRGYAPVVGWERNCRLNPDRSCIVRRGEAEAVTIAGGVHGFQGWRYRWWHREDEMAFPAWMNEGVNGPSLSRR